MQRIDALGDSVYNHGMKHLQTPREISHDRQEETPEAKALWFQSLSVADRMEVFCAFTDLILAVNPHIVEQKDAQPVPGRIQVLSAE